MARKKPTKPNHDDRAPFGFYIPSEVTTSSRTQPPAKPVKPTRVKRPKGIMGLAIALGDDAVVSYYPANIYLNQREARQRAAWLTHAAAWIEQEARRAK